MKCEQCAEIYCIKDLYRFPHPDICKLSYVCCGLSDLNCCRYCRIREYVNCFCFFLQVQSRIIYSFSWYFIFSDCFISGIKVATHVYKRNDKRRHCFPDQQFDQNSSIILRHSAFKTEIPTGEVEKYHQPLFFESKWHHNSSRISTRITGIKADGIIK